LHDTREHLLDASERLFAERGIDAVSLREITSAARVNVAAVNYHFGSKEKLVREVIARRFRPLNQERMDLLSRFEEQAGARGPKLEHVMFAFVHPVIRSMMAEPEAGANFMRLMGHVHSDVNAGLAQMVLEDMRQMIERFITATRRAMPSLTPGDIFWRAHFATGAMVHTATASGLLQAFSGGHCRVESAEELSCLLVAFISGGFKGDPERVWAVVEPALREMVQTS
jgi:AcrR family transcriptional regulator